MALQDLEAKSLCNNWNALGVNVGRVRSVLPVLIVRGKMRGFWALACLLTMAATPCTSELEGLSATHADQEAMPA